MTDGKGPAIALRLRSLVLIVLAAVLLEGKVGAGSEPAERVNGEESAVALAVEAPGEGQGGQLPGPQPNLENSFAPEEYEPPWTWWLGVILTVVSVLIVVGFGLAYYVLFHRPRQRVPHP